MAASEEATMTAAVKAASDEVLQAAAAVTKACNALNPEEGEKWAKRLDRVLDAVDAYAGAPPKGAPASSAIDATAGRLFADIESALAKIYAEIDCGDQVADIIGGKDVQKRIEDLDRRGKTNGGEKYLTYPENARYFLDEDGEEEDGDRLKLEEALETFGLEDGKKETAKENALAISSTLAERAMDMPLVAVRRGKQNNNTMYMVKSTKRPPKRIEYDFTIGRLPDRRIEDEELDKDNEGKFAYRDLESID